MKNKNVLIGVGVLVALVGGYFVVRKLLKKKDDSVRENIKGSQEPIEGLDVTTPEIPSEVKPSGGVFAGIAAFLSNWNNYEVATKSTSLNVRKSPDSKSAIVGSLPKGSSIKAKASGVKGWFEVSKDGARTYGYVSQEFLKAKP